MGTFTTTPRTVAVGNKNTASGYNSYERDFASAFGAMTSYTPSFSGFTIGNGTLVGAYTRIQKTCFFRAQLTFGTTTAAAADSPKFTVPATANANFAVGTNGLTAAFIDAGTNTYMALARWETVDTVGLSMPGTNGQRVEPSTTTPFTWTTGDVVVVSGWYEVA